MVECRRVRGLACAALAVCAAVVATLLLVAVIRAATLEDLDYQEMAIDPGLREDLPEWYLKDLPALMAKALTIPTVSMAPGEYDTEQLLRFHQFLRDSFPKVFNSSFIEAETVNTYSLLFTIQGNDSSLQPYLLASHLDVVPVVAEKWTHDPWGGLILPDQSGEDYIWGRGAIDDKLGVMGIMMALNYLALSDFQPTRTFYVGFGHDEEVRGRDGAGHIAALLEERGVTLDFLLDEGLPVLEGIIKGVDIPVAAIGVTEKGYLTVELEVEGIGGHSSMPPKDSAVARLAAALVRLDAYPQPSMFGTGPEADMFTFLAPKSSWPHKLIFSNLWLFKPFIEMIMSGSRESNAVIRTTTSITIVKAGFKENVVPGTAHAIINHRIHPSQTIEDVLEYDRSIINDPRVKVKVIGSMPAQRVSPYGPDVSAWRLLTAAIHHHFPGSVTAPGMMVGNTDTFNYLQFTRNIYRFFPVVLQKELISTIHGHNERIASAAIGKAVSFYHHLILSADQQTPELRSASSRKSGEL